MKYLKLCLIICRAGKHLFGDLVRPTCGHETLSGNINLEKLNKRHIVSNT